MALLTREPVTAMARIHDEIDRMFQEFTPPSLASLWTAYLAQRINLV